MVNLMILLTLAQSVEAASTESQTAFSSPHKGLTPSGCLVLNTMKTWSSDLPKQYLHDLYYFIQLCVDFRIMEVCLSCPLLKLSQVFSLIMSSANFVASYSVIKPILSIHWGKKCETCSNGIQLVWQSSHYVVPMKLAICTW